jgi:hypothetical protein
MKKFLAIVYTATIVLGLAGCAGGKGKAPIVVAPPPGPPPVVTTKG